MTDHSEVLRSIGAVFDHTAHAVPSIREILPIYRDLLGGTSPSGGINPSGHLALQLRFADGGKIELLQPVRVNSTSVGNFLLRNPRGGLHHLTFKVPDLAGALEEIAKTDLEPFGTELTSEHWKETYLHPRQTGGVLIQIAQAAPGTPPPIDRPLDDVLDEVEALYAESLRQST